MTAPIGTVRRTGSSVVAGGLLLLGASGTVAAHGGGTGGMMGGWGGWGGMGGLGGGLFGAGMLLWPVLLVGLLVLGWVGLSRGSTRSDSAGTAGTAGAAGTAGTDPALAELRARYARGDISDEEFETRRATLTR